MQAVIFGLEGHALTADERRFFRDAEPVGFILMGRNCRDPDQVRALTSELRQFLGHDVPVLIDQEGGRVQRLKPPHWRAAPAARRMGELAEQNREAGLEACRINARLIAAELAQIGITVDCLPVLDLLRPETTAAIGDRAFAQDPQLIAALGRAAAEGLIEGGVLPVIKHMPGHGRATADSHLELPEVKAPLAELEVSDFAAFRADADLPWGMTAHVVYAAIDGLPGTISPTIIGEVIRGRIGFHGFLVSDDLGMKALPGGFAERTRKALAAGCDAVLHCSGVMAEMEEVMKGASALTLEAQRRLAAAERRLSPPGPIERGALADRLDRLFRRAA